MNQAIFKKIYIDRDGVSGIELNDLFTLLLHPDVIAAAQWHHQTQTTKGEMPAPDGCLDQLFRDLVDSERNKQLVTPGGKIKQTTDPQKVGGLRESHLVPRVHGC